MGEVLDQARARHLLQVQARLAELHAVTLDVAHGEALADEVVQPHAAHGELPPRRAGCKVGVVDGLALDELERLAGLRSRRKEVPVAYESLPADRAHRQDGVERPALARTDVDRDDGHAANPRTAAA